MEEQWRQIEGFEYFVSDHGRLKNKSGKILSQHRNKVTGFYSVTLCKDNRYYWYYVHRLVAKAFIGEPTAKYVVHLDGDFGNNNLNNLIYSDIKIYQIQKLASKGANVHD